MAVGAGAVAAVTAPKVPAVTAGTVLDVPAGRWRYGDGDLRLRVSRVRAELARYYGDQWVWVEGERLAADDGPVGAVQALVEVTALPALVAQLDQGGEQAEAEGSP